MKIILDVDPGIDDAVAMGQVLSRKQDLELLGVTCVRGNADIDQVTINALKIVQAFDRTDVDIFKGAAHGIIKSDKDGLYFHGSDGLGGVIPEEPNMDQLKDEHAVSAINRLAQQHPGEITLICLGPLTNLALAMRLNEKLSEQLKEVVIMGGNYKGVGNVTMAAEFNFYCDPVAARVVIEDLRCPKYLVTWELSGVNKYLSKEDKLAYCNYGNKRSDFMRKLLESRDLINEECGFCDSVAVAIATNRELILNSFSRYATVDTESSLTKGMTVIGWNPQYDQTTNKLKHPNIIIVDEIDQQLYRKLFLESTK